jgi:hypothetical protein
MINNQQRFHPASPGLRRLARQEPSFNFCR